jgi:hypothetical protein
VMWGRLDLLVLTFGFWRFHIPIITPAR